MGEQGISRRELLGMGAILAGIIPLGSKVVFAEGKRILRLRAAKDMTVLDPASIRTGDENDIAVAIFNKLAVFKPRADQWTWQLDAAESIEQVDPTHVKFVLKKGMQWTNGFGEITADDVKFSFERILDPAIKATNADDWKPLDRVDVIDDYTGIIVLKTPFPALFGSTLPRPAGTIVSRKALESVGGSYTTTPPATSGPYMIKEWKPKERLILELNSKWIGEKPDFDEIHMFPITDQKAAELAFEAGEVDYTEIAVSSVQRYRSSLPPESSLIVKPLLGYEWLGMNTESKPLDDVRVRHAIKKAIDVQSVIGAAYFGEAKRATGPIPAGVLGHRELPPPERDVEGAKLLLKEAGVDGIKLTLSILNNTDTLNAAQVIQANLADVGINVEVTPFDSGAFWSLGVEKDGESWKTLQLFMHKWGAPPDPGGCTQWFTPSQIGIWNWERWNSPEFEALHNLALVELDEKKRGEMYIELQAMMDESGAYLWLTNGVQAVIHKDWIDPATTADARRLILPQFKQNG